MDPTLLVKDQIVEFAGGWQARVSEEYRKDVVFVQALGPMFCHHAFGIDHPIWKSAKVVDEMATAEPSSSASRPVAAE